MRIGLEPANRAFSVALSSMMSACGLNPTFDAPRAAAAMMVSGSAFQRKGGAGRGYVRRGSG